MIRVFKSTKCLNYQFNFYNITKEWTEKTVTIDGEQTGQHSTESQQVRPDASGSSSDSFNRS